MHFYLQVAIATTERLEQFAATQCTGLVQDNGAIAHPAAVPVGRQHRLCGGLDEQRR